MAIAYDASTDGGTNFTFAHTVGAAAKRYLVVSTVTVSAEGVPVGVTYAGVAMTLIDSQANANTARTLSMWGLANPTAGANNVVVDNTGIASGARPIAVSYSGVLQVGQPDSKHKTANTGAATSRTESTTVVLPACWLVTAMQNDNATSAGTGATQRINNSTNSVLDSNAVVGTGSQSIQATVGLASEWASIVVSLAPAVNSGMVGMFE